MPKIDSQWGAAVRHRELSSVLCDALEGWDGGGREGQERRAMYVHMADSHCCTAETNPTL